VQHASTRLSNPPQPEPTTKQETRTTTKDPEQPPRRQAALWTSKRIRREAAEAHTLEHAGREGPRAPPGRRTASISRPKRRRQAAPPTNNRKPSIGSASMRRTPTAMAYRTPPASTAPVQQLPGSVATRERTWQRRPSRKTKATSELAASATATPLAHPARKSKPNRNGGRRGWARSGADLLNADLAVGDEPRAGKPLATKTILSLQLYRSGRRNQRPPSRRRARGPWGRGAAGSAAGTLVSSRFALFCGEKRERRESRFTARFLLWIFVTAVKWNQ
jgi:hypothetical protein